MKTVDKTSRLTLFFSLEWRAEGVKHTEQFYAEKVNVWRDVLPGGMNEELIGKTTGDVIRSSLEPNQFSAPFSAALVRTILPSQFSPSTENTGKNLQPKLGRFYPQCFLTGVPGVFRVSTAHCRYVDRMGVKMVFDLNHPLAGNHLKISATILDIDNAAKERGGRCQDWLETISANEPGMQRLLVGKGSAFGVENTFRREDEKDDSMFYKTLRLVQHLDSSALKLIADQYERIILPGSAVLDLMGSWDSHLNTDHSVASLTALGMNSAELEQNKRADKIVVHDLNVSPLLPFKDESFDAIICTASIEYLKDPLPVLKDAARVLKKGGVIALSFSNRWFPTKAISVWSELHEFERVGMVVEMLSAAEMFGNLETLSVRGFPRPEGDPHSHLHLSDPVYLVSARKM